LKLDRFETGGKLATKLVERVAALIGHSLFRQLRILPGKTGCQSDENCGRDEYCCKKQKNLTPASRIRALHGSILDRNRRQGCHENVMSFAGTGAH
jgi:hypothetical protein